jgi:hypothetical protein
MADTMIERASEVFAQSLKQQADRLGFIASDAGRYPVRDGCFDIQQAMRVALLASADWLDHNGFEPAASAITREVRSSMMNAARGASGND